jgi:hypothetical protein
MKPLVMTNRKSLYARLGALFVIVASGICTLTTNGCNQGAEGDRCNPDLTQSSPAPTYNEDECGSGLTCQQPANCPENYCCPTPPATSTNPNCQAGCNGGAQSGCAAGNAADCAFLCASGMTAYCPDGGTGGGGSGTGGSSGSDGGDGGDGG